MKKIILTAVFIAILATPTQAIFCGNHIVNEGDTKVDVVRECGEPYRKSTIKTRYRQRKGRSVPSDGNVWYYNQGEGSSIKMLHFSNDKLYKVEPTNKRGWGKDKY